MTRLNSLPAGVAALVAATAYRAVYAVDVGFSTPLRVTDSPVAIAIAGETYNPSFLHVGAVDQAAGGSVDIRLSNAGNQISALDEDNAVLGAAVKVFEVLWDADENQLGAVERFSGRVDGVLYNDEGADLRVVQRAALSAGMVGRIVSERCILIFKGPDGRCGYAGAETTCNRTLARCTELANQTRWVGGGLAPKSGTKVTYRVTEYTPYVQVIQQYPPQVAPPPNIPPPGPPSRPGLPVTPPVYEVPGTRLPGGLRPRGVGTP